MPGLNKAVIDNNETVGPEQPGLHALLIGLSDYEYLSDEHRPFGFKKVLGPAASALALAQWLENADAQRILGLRLKTVRLLWLPSAAEKATNSPLAAKAGTFADADSVKQTIEAWRDECGSHQGNVAFFYFAGHGVNAGPDDVYLAMGDVGHPLDSMDSIRRCITVGNIFRAMAPSEKWMNMALQQFYFIDACRTISRSIEDPTADVRIGGNKLSANDADAARAAPIYFAANSGEVAFSDDATGTTFGKALINVLENSSADWRVDEEGVIVYPVNTDSLRIAINNAMEDELTPKGHVKHAELIVRKDAPQIDVSILVRPDEKAPNVGVNIFNCDRNCVIQTIKPVQPNAYVFKASTGRHRLEAHLMNPLAPIKPLPPKTFVGPIERWTVRT